jgi:hypothetical protein
MAMARSGSWGSRILAAVVFVSGPIACAIVISFAQGPAAVPGTALGLKQRTAFFCLWVGALCLMALLTKAAMQSANRPRDFNGERSLR